ncbi:MAG: phage portal protein [Cellulomonadaceae bacterium]|jgi:hypothetical protein|nr:phage portal protein [Cellulomonadaceae bacterium]
MNIEHRIEHGDADVQVLTDVARAAIKGHLRVMETRRYSIKTLADYARNRGGIPDVEEGASDELKDLARISRLGMCRIAVRAFQRGLAVAGFRSPQEADDDPSWSWWQRNRMGARQGIVHWPALTFGESFVSLLPHDASGNKARPAFWTPQSARLRFDAEGDPFPAEALLIARGLYGSQAFHVSATHVTPLRIDKAPALAQEDGPALEDWDLTPIAEPWEHGAVMYGKPVCPVVRFVDSCEDDEQCGVGVVEPMIELSRAMNQVNYDRLVVARHGAHNQKLIIGWEDTKAKMREMSAATIASIDRHPDEVRIDSWQASPLDPYIKLLEDMSRQFAREAAVPLGAVTDISNVSADTVAMLESGHQRELAIKRDSYGESWEMVLRLAVAMEGGQQPSDEAEVSWRDTEPRTFAGVVDGIVKLAQAGVPIEELVSKIPGITQLDARTMRDAIVRARSDSLVNALLDAPTAPVAEE